MAEEKEKCIHCKECVTELNGNLRCVSKLHKDKKILETDGACEDYKASFLYSFKMPEMKSKIKGV